MKNIFCGVVLLLTFSSAFANDEAVPPDTYLSSLPEGSRLIVRSHFSMARWRDRWNCRIFVGTCNGDYEFGKDENRPLEDGFSASIISNDKNEMNTGDKLQISKVDANRLRANIEFPDGLVIIQNNFNATRVPKTVGDFNRLLGEYFLIAYDDPAHYDPYPGMDKSTVVEIVMATIMTSIKGGNYKKALRDFAYLEKQGVSLPESFYYYYTKTLADAGEKDKARTHATDYLKTYGKKSEYYSQIIDIMSRL